MGHHAVPQWGHDPNLSHFGPILSLFGPILSHFVPFWSLSASHWLSGSIWVETPTFCFLAISGGIGGGGEGLGGFWGGGI